VLALGLAGRAIRSFGGVFSGWDDIVSWNRWAMDWYRGSLPRETWHYPQLLPAAWSLTYAFMGTERIQFFAHGMMPLFSLAAVAVTLDLARGPQRLAFLAGAWFTGVFLQRINNVTAGLADIPVAFFALAAIVELLRPEEGGADGTRRRLLVGSVLAAGAALTKQAGLYIAALYPILAAALVGRPARRLRIVALEYAVIAALVLPWYAYKEVEIRSGRATSEIGTTTLLAHEGRSLPERLEYGGVHLAQAARGPVALGAVAGLLLLGLRERRIRLVATLVGLPFLLIWAGWFSYDLRNASLALGPLALGCGAGLAGLAGRLRRPVFPISWPRRRGLPAHAGRLVAAAGILLAVLALWVPDAALIARQERLQRGIGDRKFASALYAHRDRFGITGKILSDSRFLLGYTPGWDSSFIFTPFGDAAAFANVGQRADVTHLVTPRPAPPEIAPILAAWERSGRFVEAFRAGAYVLWKRAEPTGGARHSVLPYRRGPEMSDRTLRRDSLWYAARHGRGGSIAGHVAGSA